MGLFNRKPKEPAIAVGGEYFASHPAIKGHFDPLTLNMTDTGIVVEGDKRPLHTFSWNQIISFDDENLTETTGAGQRITATRIVTLGIFALAAPKATGRTKTQFINTLHTTTGDIVIELALNGAASSNVGKFAAEAIKKHSHSVRAFVAEHARG